MSDIFLSYDSADRPVAQLFADALESQGLSVWWDREIPLGKSFDQVIEEQLNAARCAIVLWSKESVRSRWVRSEASWAANRECLLPVLIDDAAIPLEFRQIQTANLSGWQGDPVNPEFNRLLDAVADLIRKGQGRPAAAPVVKTLPPIDRRTRMSALVVGLVAAAILLLTLAVPIVRRFGAGAPGASSTTPAAGGTASSAPAIDVAAPSPSASPSSPSPEGGGNAFAIAIGDRIKDGVPAVGAGTIEKASNQDVYAFSAKRGQRVYFRLLDYSPTLSGMTWKLTDEDGGTVFDTCFGCTEPGVHQLTTGGRYTLTIGPPRDRATGTYRFRLFDVPPPSRYPVKIGDTIGDDLPSSGAGTIESPGAEDVYTFTATPRQRVYFRVLGVGNGMSSQKWKLTDDDGMDVFNTCFGCTEPGVQALNKGGTYTLTVGSATDPATGTYHLRLLNVPAPDRFMVAIGARIKPGVPGPGAGVIESPGREDEYAFTTSAGQQARFRLSQFDQGMAQKRWRLIDDNGMELFNTCFGCSAPDVQRFTRGGRYTLIVGSATEPSTGEYSVEIAAP